MPRAKNNLIDDVKTFAKKFIDTAIYTSIEWEVKEQGNYSFGDIILVAEGELNHVLNGYTVNKSALNKLNDIAKKHGYYIEQGYSWSWHFVKLAF